MQPHSGFVLVKMTLPIVLAAGIASWLLSQTTALAQTSGTGKTGTVEKIQVHGKSLEGNLEGDSADRDVFIYLPPSYATDPNRSYPVVYFLHGYGLHAQQWVGF